MTQPTARNARVRVLGEGTVIVLSILLAFALEAWWDESSARREVDEMLVLLTEEVQENKNTLDASIEAHRSIHWEIDQVVEAGFLQVAAGALIPYEVYDPATGVLDALVASGMLREIEDASLRVTIASLSGRFSDLFEKERRAVERRELARNRFASLGFRVEQRLTLPADLPAFRDVETLNLLAMRRFEESEAIRSGEALARHLENLESELLDLGLDGS